MTMTMPHINKDIDRAQQLLTNAITASKERVVAMISLISNTVIRDRLVQPEELQFRSSGGMVGFQQPDQIVFAIDKERVPYTLHRHALGQMADKISLPIKHVNNLDVSSKDDWRRELLAENLNEMFHKTEFPPHRGGGPLKFLLRFVGQELRGFQSRTYGRHLASIPMLRAFLEACREVGATPATAQHTSVRYSLSAYLPHAFEPFPGEAVAIGMRWANSDFGAGKLSVSLCIMHVRRGTSAVLSDEFSRIHLGSLIQEGDIEVSAETEAKEVDAAASIIRDVVVGKLKPESVSALLRAIDAAHTAQVDWTQLKGQLKSFLLKDELTTLEAIVAGERTGSIDLPPPGTGADGRPLPTKWWASNLVAWFADQTDDVDRKADLQVEAGKFLESFTQQEPKKVRVKKVK